MREELGKDVYCHQPFFSLYTEELAARMRRMNAGVRVGNDRICVLFYADDVVVMSESADELQNFLDVVDGYKRDFGVRFSSKKSKVMIVNRSVDESNAVWRLGENELKQAQEYKYLGMWMSPNGCEKAKNEKISLVNQCKRSKDERASVTCRKKMSL